MVLREREDAPGGSPQHDRPGSDRRRERLDAKAVVREIAREPRVQHVDGLAVAVRKVADERFPSDDIHRLGRLELSPSAVLDEYPAVRVHVDVEGQGVFDVLLQRTEERREVCGGDGRGGCLELGEIVARSRAQRVRGCHVASPCRG